MDGRIDGWTDGQATALNDVNVENKFWFCFSLFFFFVFFLVSKCVMQTQEKQFRTKNGFVSVITLLWSIICSVKFTKVLFLPVINFQMFHKKATITISINVALSTVLCGLQLAQESELRLLFETRNNEVYQIYFKMIQINT